MAKPMAKPGSKSGAKQSGKAEKRGKAVTKTVSKTVAKTVETIKTRVIGGLFAKVEGKKNVTSELKKSAKIKEPSIAVLSKNLKKQNTGDRKGKIQETQGLSPKPMANSKITTAKATSNLSPKPLKGSIAEAGQIKKIGISTEPQTGKKGAKGKSLAPMPFKGVISVEPNNGLSARGKIAGRVGGAHPLAEPAKAKSGSELDKVESKESPTLRSNAKVLKKGSTVKGTVVRTDRPAETRRVRIDRTGMSSDEHRWADFYDKFQKEPVQVYNMSGQFLANRPLEHKVLGWGYIISIENDRLEVLFRSGLKMLISNYKNT